MKQTYTLSAQERTLTGKGGARKTRAAGHCPAVLYGPDFEARTIQVDPRALQKMLHAAGDNPLIDLTVTGEGATPETVKVIIRSMDYSPMTELPEHIDFYKVSLDRAISITVPVELTGTCEAVETKAGVVSQLVHELHVDCLPTDIPENILVDISSLKIGHAMHVSDLTVPPGVEITDSPELPVVSLNAVKEEAEEEVAPEMETAEPELVKAQREGEEES